MKTKGLSVQRSRVGCPLEPPNVQVVIFCGDLANTGEAVHKCTDLKMLYILCGKKVYEN